MNYAEYSKVVLFNYSGLNGTCEYPAFEKTTKDSKDKVPLKEYKGLFGIVLNEYFSFVFFSNRLRESLNR